MPRSTNVALNAARRWMAAFWLVVAVYLVLPHGTSYAQAPKLPQLNLHWQSGELLADVDTQWQAPASIKQVLERGVPLVFTLQATVTQPRWYWRDKVLASLTRRTRVVYSPLTSQWRVSLADSETASTNTDVYLLHQNVPSMSQAIALAANTRGWVLGRTADFETSTNTQVTVNFALDTAALPRPFQIGVAEQGDWGASVTLTVAMPATDLTKPTTKQSAPPLAAPKPAPVVTAEQLNQGRGALEEGKRP